MCDMFNLNFAALHLSLAFVTSFRRTSFFMVCQVSVGCGDPLIEEQGEAINYVGP